MRHVPKKTLPILTVRFDNELVSTQPPPSQTRKPLSTSTPAAGRSSQLRLTIRILPLRGVICSAMQQASQTRTETDTRLQADDDLLDKDGQLWDRVEQECAFADEDEDDGPDWMFEAQEKAVKYLNYTFCPALHRRGLLRLFTKHFVQHPSLPDQHGYHTPQDIYEKAVFEMYLYTIQRGLSEVWAYMWMSWYQPSQWKYWARSASKRTELMLVDRVRTTMMAENFHRQLKHNFLHHVHRPRLDHTLYVHYSGARHSLLHAACGAA